MIKIDMEMPKACFDCPFAFIKYGDTGVFACTITKKEFARRDDTPTLQKFEKERLDNCPLCPETAAEDKDAISRRHLSEKMLEVVNAELEDAKTDKKVTADRYFFTLGRLFGLLFAEPALGELKEGAEK